MTGVTAREIAETGKIRHIKRLEIASEFANAGDDLAVSPLEKLPFAPASTNLIVSPLSAHLTNDTPGLFIQAMRALQPDGLFLAAIPGCWHARRASRSPVECRGRADWRRQPSRHSVSDVRDIGALLQRAGFALPVADVETYTVRYDSLFPLMRDLRHMGMANPLTNRSRRPVSRKFFVRAAEIYAERFSDPDGRIRATFSIIYVQDGRRMKASKSR